MLKVILVRDNAQSEFCPSVVTARIASPQPSAAVAAEHATLGAFPMRFSREYDVGVTFHLVQQHFQRQIPPVFHDVEKDKHQTYSNTSLSRQHGRTHTTLHSIRIRIPASTKRQPCFSRSRRITRRVCLSFLLPSSFLEAWASCCMLSSTVAPARPCSD